MKAKARKAPKIGTQRKSYTPQFKEQALTGNGKVRYELKTSYRDNTSHVFFEPVDFIARLAALVPKPLVNLTRFHGVFARGGLPPNSKHRALVAPGKRGKGRKPADEGSSENTIAERRKAMTCTHKGHREMQRLKRVFTKSRCFRRHRYSEMRTLRRACQGRRLNRRCLP